MGYFLKEDLETLDRKIKETKKEIEKALREIGESCQQGAETSHDNPGYEEGQRAAAMWSNHLRQLLLVRREASLVEYTPLPTDGKVRIGCLVTVKYLDTGEEKSFRVGSAMIFDNTGTSVSYMAPLGQAVLGITIGDIVEVTIGDKRKRLLLLNVQWERR
ncbi:MAG: GreA/GreB family elongation factor [Patescibacteria group bacterium]